jgi:hypothetical protein
MLFEARRGRGGVGVIPGDGVRWRGHNLSISKPS